MKRTADLRHNNPAVQRCAPVSRSSTSTVPGWLCAGKPVRLLRYRHVAPAEAYPETLSSPMQPPQDLPRRGSGPGREELRMFRPDYRCDHNWRGADVLLNTGLTRGQFTRRRNPCWHTRAWHESFKRYHTQVKKGIHDGWQARSRVMC
ncbi:hypothetical protein MPH_03902 [Macrophomina phaseolina MS6]|uniref:Uncharacterized protein n=1 Tax=Macrophomina phaseolina (strain MS6) TaxID=1126212 RepID=K2R8W3_MACPH|nr:hypothetical protein MPH_03902 [Macrophomina phaseolina MS6]